MVTLLLSEYRFHGRQEQYSRTPDGRPGDRVPPLVHPHPPSGLNGPAHAVTVAVDSSRQRMDANPAHQRQQDPQLEREESDKVKDEDDRLGEKTDVSTVDGRRLTDATVATAALLVRLGL